jgi:hypothetical protein
MSSTLSHSSATSLPSPSSDVDEIDVYEIDVDEIDDFHQISSQAELKTYLDSEIPFLPKQLEKLLQSNNLGIKPFMMKTYMRDVDGLTFYYGQIVCGIKFGTGMIIYPDGTKFVGTWFKGKYHGPGKLFDKFGVLIQDCIWENGEPVFGTFYDTTNGTTYRGLFKSGQKWGFGTMTESDGSSFTGSFVCNKRIGNGYITYPNGTQEPGKWNEDGSWVPLAFVGNNASAGNSNASGEIEAVVSYESDEEFVDLDESDGYYSEDDIYGVDECCAPKDDLSSYSEEDIYA